VVQVDRPVPLAPPVPQIFIPSTSVQTQTQLEPQAQLNPNASMPEALPEPMAPVLPMPVIEPAMDMVIKPQTTRLPVISAR
jgi:hypothetical protein